MVRNLAFALLTLATAATAAFTPIGPNVQLFGSSDPLIDIHAPALAVNTQDDHALYFWHRDEGTGAYGLFFAVTDLSPTPTLVAAQQTVDATIGTTRNVEAAYDPTTGRTLIVWEQTDDPSIGAFEIWGRLIESDYSFFGTPFRISEMGSDPTDTAFDAGMPDVAVNTLDGEFVVVWHGDDDAAGGVDGDFRIYARRIGADRTLYGTGRDVIARSDALGDRLDPVVVFDDFRGEFVVAYAAGTVIALSRLELDGSLVGGSPNEELVGANIVDGTVVQRNAALAFDQRRKRVLVVWDELTLTGVSLVASRLVDPDQSPTAQPVVVVSSSSTNSLFVARDPVAVYSLPADRFVVAWSGSVFTNPNVGEKEISAADLAPDGSVSLGSSAAISVTGPANESDYEAVTPTLAASQASESVLCAWSSSADVPGAFGFWSQFLDVDALTAVSTPEDRRPEALALRAAPNPFNPQTTISFALPRDGRTKITIHDARGKRVRTLVDASLDAGDHRRTWNGTDDGGRSVGSGVYFARIVHEGETLRRKLTLVK